MKQVEPTVETVIKTLRVIDGEKVETETKYVCRPFGSREGLALLVKMFKLVDISGIDSLTLNEDKSEIGIKLLGAAQRSITPNILLELVDKLAERCTLFNKDGVPMPLSKHFDRHFGQNYNEMIQWAWWVLDVNYSSFLVSKPEENLSE